MSRLLLIRHAEPALKGHILGRADPGLSPEGRAAAMAAMPRVTGQVAYVSPLERARETAAWLPAAIPRIVLEDLAEVAQGAWEGLLWEEIERRWPDLARRKLEDWFSAPAPGGETWEDACARAARVLERVRAGPTPAIVVAHQGINSALAHRLAGVDPGSYRQPYCEVFEFSLGDTP